MSRWKSPTAHVNSSEESSMEGLTFRPGLVRKEWEDKVWPTLDLIRTSQKAALDTLDDTTKDKLRLDEEGGFYTDSEGRVWVPSEDLRVRICIIGHCAGAGH